MMPFFWVGMLLAAQDGRPATVAELVPKLVENGKQYEASLPSLSCEESVRSQIMHKGKVETEVTATATMTVKRTGDKDEPFVETHRWKTRDGKPLVDGQRADLPLFVNGVFIQALGFRSLDILDCNDFALTDLAGLPELWLSYGRKPDAGSDPGCKTRTPGTRDTVSIDRQSGHVTRVLHTVPDDEALATKTVSYGSVEYAPVRLGAETFWLPKGADTRTSGDERRMVFEYSGCHRFTSTVTITGGTDVIPAPQ